MNNEIECNCVNGVKIPIGAKKVTVINGDVFVDGKQYIRGEWKVTLRAIFHMVF